MSFDSRTTMFTSALVCACDSRDGALSHAVDGMHATAAPRPLLRDRCSATPALRSLLFVDKRVVTHIAYCARTSFTHGALMESPWRPRVGPDWLSNTWSNLNHNWKEVERGTDDCAPTMLCHGVIAPPTDIRSIVARFHTASP